MALPAARRALMARRRRSRPRCTQARSRRAMGEARAPTRTRRASAASSACAMAVVESSLSTDGADHRAREGRRAGTRQWTGAASFFAELLRRKIVRARAAGRALALQRGWRQPQLAARGTEAAGRRARRRARGAARRSSRRSRWRRQFPPCRRRRPQRGSGACCAHGHAARTARRGARSARSPLAPVAARVLSTRVRSALGARTHRAHAPHAHAPSIHACCRVVAMCCLSVPPLSARRASRHVATSSNNVSHEFATVRT